MSERTRRLFFALWPSDELRRDIERETRHDAQRSGGRVIPAANFHITLAFLGAVPETRIADLKSCLFTARVEPFALTVGALAWWEQQQLLCLEPVSGAEAVIELVDRLRVALRRQGLAVEQRPFRPHVTLARDVRREQDCKSISGLSWQVQRIELIESQARLDGSVYTIVPT